MAPVEYYVNESNENSKGEYNIQDKMTSDLSHLFAWSNINFLTLGKKIAPPKSFLDALHLSNEFSLDYIIYGFIEKNEYSIHGELKLFDSKKQEIIRVFYSTDNADKLARLSRDLVSKIEEYFKSIFNMPLPGKKIKTGPSHGIISFVLGAGYWTPVTSKWNEYNLGLYSIDLHTRLIPTRPREGTGFRGFYFRTGLVSTFFHSMNREGYEQYNLYTFTFGIPAALCADIGTKHTLGLGLEPQFTIDYLIQDRMYDDRVMIPIISFSGAVNLEYQYFITPGILIGISNRVSFTFTEPVRIIYNPLVLFEFRLKPLSEKRSGEKS
jgi:hypothetical protein